MKNIVFIVLVFIGTVANAQSRKQLKAHRSRIEASKQQKTAIVSLDSFFCSGIKYAVAGKVNNKPKSETITYIFKGLKNGDTLIVVHPLVDSSSAKLVNYYHFGFPALKSACDLIKSGSDTNVYQIICRYRLLNDLGLDTFRAESFVSVKGQFRLKEESKKNTSTKFRMPERDRSAKIIIIESDIYQDSTIIGSFAETMLKSPNGEELRQIQVYNKQKQPVSFSTETRPGSNEWRTITNQDAKYHMIKSSANSEKVLNDILEFLIGNQYL